MAIKTTGTGSGLRVLTKTVDGEVRVSCECCEEGCCMYPADLLGSAYEADGLPDAVTVNWTGRFTGSMSRSGSGYAGEGATLQVVDDIWQLNDGAGSRNVGRCLITGDGNLTPGNNLVEDQFADTYMVYVNGLADVFDETFTVVRRSLCVWSSSVDEGDPSGVILTPPQLFSEKWVVIVGGEAQTKDDPQNTPVGLYGDQGTDVFPT